jgi:glycosyltransferase involved in cell wall biosynthesis
LVADRIPVSAVVMTRNEERNLARCLRSLDRVAEVFVVDSHSEDATCSIAETHGARVVQFDWNGRYPKKKQWCLDNLPFAHDWVLFLDADEELGPELSHEIGALLVDGPEHAGYFVGYDYVFLGRVLRHGHRVYKLVLLDRLQARFPELPDLEAGNADEVEPHYQPDITGTTGVLSGRAVHDDHDSLFHYFDRHNRYSDWEAILRAKGALPRRGEAQPPFRGALKVVFSRLPFKGLAAFLHSYVLKLGFLDGRAGLHFALARGFYYWQVGLKTKESQWSAAADDPMPQPEGGS